MNKQSDRADSTRQDAVYRTLAQRLDALPNGFPGTEDGAELRLLAKIFTFDEAVLAAAMTATPEPYETIAARAGVEPRAAYSTLKDMVRRGLIIMRRGEAATGARTLQFGLMPFVVGFYEAQLPRMDAEMAALFEDYFYATRGIDVPGPSVHRVIPVGEAVPGEIEVHPFEQATALIEAAKSWAVRDCICRTQQRLLDKGCDAPLENCLVFAPVEGVFEGGGVDRPITKEEALRILGEAADAGLVHSVSNHREGHNYICSCCTCCCGVLRRVAEFAVPTAIARSAFRAQVDATLCTGCSACEDRCQFGAVAVTGGVAAVDALRCVGCGQCALVCPTGAMSLARRPEAEIENLPTDGAAWAAARMAERSLPQS
jgi:Na+-translocating ferredoxin:NAD+ oxidoreductase subunit B